MPSLRQIRLATGLVLYVYVTLHFANHALGNISIGAMESGLALQKLIWQSLPGAVILYVSLLTHMSLGFWALYERRRFRWTRLEATQLVLGLSIPFLLTNHVIGTRVALSQFGLEKGYAQELANFWVFAPLLGALQAILLLIVWIHGCLGVHFWLQAQAVLPAREGTAAFDRGASAYAGAARLLSGRPADLGGGSGPCMAGAQFLARARRDPGSERGPSGRAHADARLPGCRARRHALRPGLPTMEGAPGRLDPADLSRPHDSRSAGLQRAGSEPHQQHPACACVRRPRPLLDLPHPRPWRRHGPPGPERRRAGGARTRARGPRGQARLPASSDPRHRACAHALPVRDDGRRLSDRSRLFGGRALCGHHVCRHARIEPAGREAPAVRHRVHHQPVSQRREQRGVERRRASPTKCWATGCWRCSVWATRPTSPAGRRSPPAPQSPPGSRASTARWLMRWSSRSASASASTPA